jgi:hypothetical protein
LEEPWPTPEIPAVFDGKFHLARESCDVDRREGGFHVRFAKISFRGVTMNTTPVTTTSQTARRAGDIPHKTAAAGMWTRQSGQYLLVFARVSTMVIAICESRFPGDTRP